MGKFPSIFQAEVHAIERCAQIILDKRTINARIAIMSDSQAALKALDSNLTSSKMVMDCKTKLNLVGTKNSTELFWVPGHKDIFGNERADELARKGAATPFTGPEPFCGLNPPTISKEIKDRLHARWEEYWDQLPSCRHSKIFMVKINRKRWENLLTLPKNSLRVVTGFITGHCKLGLHLSKLKITTEDLCRFCQDAEETPSHLMLECHAVARHRWETLGFNNPTCKQIQDLKPQEILTFLKKCGILETL